MQTLLPSDAEVQLAQGDDLYRYGSKLYPAKRKTGPAPECRIEVSPHTAQRDDLFLHVLTAAAASVESAPAASVQREGNKIEVRAGDSRITFDVSAIGGEVNIAGRREPLQAKP